MAIQPSVGVYNQRLLIIRKEDAVDRRITLVAVFDCKRLKRRTAGKRVVSNFLETCRQNDGLQSGTACERAVGNFRRSTGNFVTLGQFPSRISDQRCLVFGEEDAVNRKKTLVVFIDCERLERGTAVERARSDCYDAFRNEYRRQLGIIEAERVILDFRYSITNTIFCRLFEILVVYQIRSRRLARETTIKRVGANLDVRR